MTLAQNRDNTVKAKPRGKPFLPGNCANPGGRPKMPKDLKELAQASAPEALRIALDLMKTAKSEQVKLRAAEIVMDRGYGKPAQSIDANVNAEVELAVRVDV